MSERDDALNEALRVAKKARQTGYVPWMAQGDWSHGKRDVVAALERLIGAKRG